MYRFEGLDSKGVRRVYGQHRIELAALVKCKEEAAEYVARRPDTGPLSLWKIIGVRPITGKANITIS